jgi:hypothetical protein
VAGEIERRDPVSGQFEPDNLPELVGEVRTVDGVVGHQLAAEQARVLWEVTEWQAQNRCVPGRRHAA